MLSVWTAIKLGYRAKQLGLALSVDRLGRYYLSPSQQEGPLVLCAVTLDEVRRYLDLRAPSRRSLKLPARLRSSVRDALASLSTFLASL
jgi:hypothetical protein